MPAMRTTSAAAVGLGEIVLQHPALRHLARSPSAVMAWKLVQHLRSLLGWAKIGVLWDGSGAMVEVEGVAVLADTLAVKAALLPE